MRSVMVRVSLRGVRSHKRRFTGVALAVFLGVAFLSGTWILSDTLKSSIDGLIARANAGTDAVVRNAASVDSSPGAKRGPIPARTAAVVRAVPGVADAVPVIDGFGQIVGSDGKAISQN